MLVAYSCFGPEISPSATFQITNCVGYGKGSVDVRVCVRVRVRVSARVRVRVSARVRVRVSKVLGSG